LNSPDEYSLILETPGVAIMVLEEDTTVSLVNPEFEKLTGYKKEEIEGKKSWTELVVQDDLQTLTEYYRQRMTEPTQAPSNCEVRFVTREGEAKDVLLTIGLIPGTKRSVASVMDITEWKRVKEQQLTYMATHDVVTGLPSRVVFNDRLNLALARTQRTRKKFAIMLMDLDKFKNVNDRLGHTVGDELLRAVALRLKGILRKSDTVARMGGDEFLFLLPEIDRTEAVEVVARRILELFRQPFLIQGHRIHITSSIGISLYPQDGKDPDNLIRNADIAMYYVKQQGRDNYQRYTPSISSQPVRFKVLLLEEDPSYIEIMQTMLTVIREPQFDLECFSRLSKGLRRLGGGDVDVVLVDLSLPDSTGLDTLSEILEHAPGVPVIVLAKSDDADLAIKAVQAGAQDYLIKGEVDDTLLVRSIHYSIERHRIQDELKRQMATRERSSAAQVREILEKSTDGVVLVDEEGTIRFVNLAAQERLGRSAEELVGTLFEHPLVVGETTEIEGARTNGKQFTLEARVVQTEWEHETVRLVYLHDISNRKRAEQQFADSFNKWRSALDGIIEALAATIGVRDVYVATHQRRVTSLACAIAEEMGFPGEQLEGLRLAATIHDIGKVYVPAEILNKPGQLSDAEYKMIQAHPQVGYEILKNVECPWPVAKIVHQHHERLDGTGYPQGLKGEDIIPEAKILAVADVVEATVSVRSYRPARGLEEALVDVSSKKGVLYDPEVVDACVRLFTEKDFSFEE